MASIANDPNILTPRMRAATTYNRKVVRLHRLLSQARALVNDLSDNPVPAEVIGWTEDAEHAFNNNTISYDWALGTILRQIDSCLPYHLEQQVNR